MEHSSFSDGAYLVFGKMGVLGSHHEIQCEAKEALPLFLMAFTETRIDHTVPL